MSDELNYSDLMELDPEAFDWLEMAEEFFKHEGSFSFGEERNNNLIRAGKRYNEIEREYNQLQKLYEACPEHVVEPLMPIYTKKNGERKMIGFYMERFEGEILKDYLASLENEEILYNSLEVIEEVDEVIESIHEEGVVHGDMTNNILYDGESFRFFDPVGEPYTEKGYSTMKKWDESTPERLEEIAKLPFQEFL